MNRNKRILSFILILSMILGIFQSTIYAQSAAAMVKAKVKISAISNLSFTTAIGSEFKLPSTVTAQMSDKTTKNISVKWNASKVSTSNAGTFRYYGTVEGYSKKVTLTLTVKSVTVQDIAKEGSKVVLLKIFNEDDEEIAQGSGFILTEDGKVITNYHVIMGGKAIKAVMSNNEEYAAAYIVDYDIDKDIALIQLSVNKKLPYVKIGDSDKLQVGDSIVAIGSPMGLQNTMSIGIVSAIRQSNRVENSKEIQISSPISSGSSGGALFNMAGEVVGITYAVAYAGQNLNFAIPINDIKKFNYSGKHDFADVYIKEHIIEFDNGDIYEGETKKGIPSGYGVLNFENGDVYKGEFLDGLFDGEGIYIWPNGTLYKGEFKEGMFHGKGIRNWSNGDSYEGYYKNDKKEGTGIYYFANGDIYNGEFIDDNFEGKGTYYFADGVRYVGEFIDDKFEGKGTIYFPDGAKYAGGFKNDKFEGNGVFTFPNGGTLELKFSDGVMVGTAIMTSATGQKLTARQEGNNMIFTDENNKTFSVPIDLGANNVSSGNSNSNSNTNSSSNNNIGSNNTNSQSNYYVNTKDPLNLINICQTGENVVIKWGYLVIVFDRNMATSPAPSRVILESETGERIIIKSIQPGSTAKDNLLLILSKNLKPNTRYKVFIPKNTIFSEDGQVYPYDIEYSFKTAP